MHNQIIFDFIKSEFPIKRTKFPIKRTKTTQKKWTNAIIIPEGYLRKERKSYPTKDTLNKARIAADIIQIVMNVFGCHYNMANDLVVRYLKTIRL